MSQLFFKFFFIQWQKQASITNST